ncbi:DinB family protein [Larkinella soli]|uniref:DinB family protein n=1 Tax=Larkinella soli TaxID=1770527 RepID=UPI000FFC8699|nr:DinB family protein [Larkinella soli]
MKDYMIRLLEYERWANQRVIESLEQVNTPPLRAIQLMGHILSAQQVWLARLTGTTPFVAVWEDIPIVWMQETAERNFRNMKALLEGEPDDGLDRPIAYATTRGEPFTSTLADILTHLSHHAAYHRGQIVQLLRPELQTPPVTDYIVFAR